MGFFSCATSGALFIVVIVITTAEASDLVPCLFKEGLSYEIDCSFGNANSITALDWRTRLDTTITTCYKCSCGYYSLSPFNATVQCVNNYILSSTLIIVHRNRTWFENIFPLSCVTSPVTASSVITPCSSANVYVPPENVVCNTPTLSADGQDVSIVCTTNKTYPAAKCIVSVQNRNYTNTTCTSTSYTISGNEYMTTTCSFVTQVGGLQLGSNVFSAYLYPDVINGTQFAVRANDVSIDLVHPVSGLRKCRNGPDDYIKFGEFYSCECTNSTQGNLPVLYQWLDESNGVLGAGVLHQVANITGVPSKLFKCQPQYLWNNTLVGTAVLFLAKFAYGPTDVQLYRKDNTNLSEIYNLCPTTGNITFVCDVMKTTVNPEPSISMYQNNLPLSFSTQHNSSSYNYISSFQPRSAGVLVFGCLVENSKNREINVNTSLQVMVRAPPSTKSEVAITNGIITGTQFILKENMTYGVSCKVDGGVNILISCGALHIETSTSTGKLTLPSVSRNLQNTNCTCTASHITGCYTNNVSWYTLNITSELEI